MKKLSFQNVINYFTLLLLLAAVAIRGGADFKWFKSEDVKAFTIADFEEAFPQATSFKENNDRSFSFFNEEGVFLGYGLVSERFDARYSGYSGHVPIVIAMTDKRVITGVYLLANNETNEYLEYIHKQNLLQSWNQFVVGEELLTLEVDAASGATRSSTAIINTFNLTVGNYLDVAANIQTASFIRVLQSVLTGLLVLVSFLFVFGSRLKKYYFYYLTAVLLLLGIWFKQMLSVGVMHNWLVNGLPMQTNYELVLILILAIVMGLLGYRKYYCNYLCPMGALQMLVSKLSPLKKRSLNMRISQVQLRLIYLTFIWVALILGFSLPLASMEPFVAFSFNVASKLMLLFGVLIILLSIFFNRPWCQFCPTGCALDTIEPVKPRIK